MLSVVIPANDEEDCLPACLEALLAQTGPSLEAEGLEVIVAANACRDATVALARGYADRFAARGWRFETLDIPQGGKPNALDHGDDAARGALRAYLDADVVCSPRLLDRTVEALCVDGARYATGRLRVARARNWTTRRYAEAWTRLPFVAQGTTGAGFFAVNAAGRARWGRFPRIISDDTFVRLSFAPEERVEVPADYVWPMVEGFSGLVRVRRRQDAGVAEVRRLYPALLRNETPTRPGPGALSRIALAAPAGLAIYVAVAAAVRIGDRGRRGGTQAWSRGKRVLR